MVATHRKRRPYKMWYKTNCVVCDREYLTCRKHSETCGTRCRKRLERGGFMRHEKRIARAGLGTEPPRVNLELGAGYIPQIHARLRAAADAQALTVGVSPAAIAGDGPELFDIEFSDGMMIRTDRDGVADVLDSVDRLEETAAENEARERYLAAVEACRLCGLTLPAVTRPEYERARKRVFNLLAARKRGADEKSALRVAWALLQGYYEANRV